MDEPSLKPYTWMSLENMGSSTLFSSNTVWTNDSYYLTKTDGYNMTNIGLKDNGTYVCTVKFKYGNQGILQHLSQLNVFINSEFSNFLSILLLFFFGEAR